VSAVTSSTRAELRCGDRTFALGTRTFVMGIVNVTPDSFSDGGRHDDVDRAVAHAERLLADGADVLDVGGESTRPGADHVPADVELSRVLPVIERLVARGIRALSVDTRNASTARACLDAGCAWVNDVSALSHDDAMATTARSADAVVLMHARPMSVSGTGDVVHYDDVVREVRAYLGSRVQLAHQAGIDVARVVVDPGLGFGKRVVDNLQLLAHLDALVGVGAALLVGPSRKRFLGDVARIEKAADRDSATLGAVSFAATRGADIVRVHDVKACVEALRVVDAILRA
jgi:dihydropteroate synthase